LQVSVGATAYVKRLSRHKRWRIYSTFHLTTPFALLLFGGGRGAGLAPQKAYDYRQRSGAGFAVKWSGRKRDRIVT